MSGLFSLLVEPLGGQTGSHALKPPLLGILNHKCLKTIQTYVDFIAQQIFFLVVQHEQVRAIAT